MKRIAKTTAWIVIMAGSCGAAFAQCKVALVNMQEVIIGSDEAMARSVKFDARVIKVEAVYETFGTQREFVAASCSKGVATVIRTGRCP